MSINVTLIRKSIRETVALTEERASHNGGTVPVSAFVSMADIVEMVLSEVAKEQASNAELRRALSESYQARDSFRRQVEDIERRATRFY